MVTTDAPNKEDLVKGMKVQHANAHTIKHINREGMAATING